MTDPFAAYRAEYPGRFASPEAIAYLSRERFKPWPLPRRGANRPLFHCTQGFVRNERFGTGLVIAGMNRSKQRNELRKAQAARKP